jgi:uncharacterized caspase-like protein
MLRLARYCLAALLLMVALPRLGAAALSAADLKHMHAETRVALVIGNGDYQNFPRLANPTNDATGVAAALKAAGFRVTLKLNATYQDMNQALDVFAQQLRGADVGLFYYAGHATQVNWRNFILPVAASLDADRVDASNLADEVAQVAVDLGDVLKRMDHRNGRLNIVILDACRDNPLTDTVASISRSLSRSTGKTPVVVGTGLAQSAAPPETILAYSTAPGQVASDGDGRDSPYSAALIQALGVPGLNLEQVFKQVGNAVAKATANEQVPWQNSSVTRDFYFRIPAPIDDGLNTSFVSP